MDQTLNVRSTPAHRHHRTVPDGTFAEHDGPKKRKKAAKTPTACINCSRSHLSCNSGRPCNRCVKKGLQNTCIDKPRKRKLDMNSSLKELSSPSPTSINDDLLKPRSQSLTRTRPGSTSSDYSSLSKISHHGSPVEPILSRMSSMRYDLSSSDKVNFYSQNSLGTTQNAISVEEFQSRSPAPGSSTLDIDYGQISMKRINAPLHPLPSCSSLYENLLGPSTQEILSTKINLLAHHFPLTPIANETTLNFKRALVMPNNIVWDSTINQYNLDSKKRTFPEVLGRLMQNKEVIKDPIVSLSLRCDSPDEITMYESNQALEHSLRYSRPIEIYTLISKPFSHTPGFHHLFNYLRIRFTKDKLITISKALAEFRPIFIASSITLTEEDMIFMEQTFQRTLLEYSKFFKLIGTPSCIWRRNGQLSLVNEEFEILTGWSSKELLHKMTFIVELMDDTTAVNYFKTFSQIAYKDFNGSAIMRDCVILTPIKDKVVKCHCVWTMKRDMSGLPLMIIGNFMPNFE